MTTDGVHQSNSATQNRAEAEIVAALARSLGVALSKPGRIVLAGGASIEVDAATADMSVIVEAYAAG